jgi:organic hydroperoxide reductase OsmC/OhrA
MSEYRATVQWKRESPQFSLDTYNRAHITRVTLRPKVQFGGSPPPPEQLAKMHEKAHENCFLANSVLTSIHVEPR